jgi:hypothetical protein
MLTVPFSSMFKLNACVVLAWQDSFCSLYLAFALSGYFNIFRKLYASFAAACRSRQWLFQASASEASGYGAS